jgi:hypothetical protein
MPVRACDGRKVKRKGEKRERERKKGKKESARGGERRRDF